MGKQAVWIDAEVLAMLNTLEEKKDQFQSGNGWKPTVWPSVVTAVHLANPSASPPKDQKKVKSKLDYLQETFALYLFVEKFSGSGWDEAGKHAVNTEQYVEEFAQSHGKQYRRCFETPCPFYQQLDQLYDGLKNKATGDHVIHFGTKKSTTRRKSTNKENPAASGSNDTSTATATPSDDTRAPMAPHNVDGEAASGSDKAVGSFDDELARSPVKPSNDRKRTRAESEDAGNDDTDSTKRRKREKSDTSSGSVARRNAEAGTQLSRSVDNLAASMAKPIVTMEDLSHVDDVVRILGDDSLLPPDPRGKLYRLVLSALSSNPALARGFIIEERPERRKGMVIGILEDAGIQVPDDF
ncbi:hypothetical protein C8R47DRAFT_1230045 [Mycena vitilis]|nr:hypothetical protein C8R47DRAFT_1230045 [Mycena vitilis]